jgi:hypothetical protein
MEHTGRARPDATNAFDAQGWERRATGLVATTRRFGLAALAPAPTCVEGASR